MICCTETDIFTGGQNPFEPTELQMGVREIRVDKIFNFGKSTYVVGENFTPYSKVAVNGDSPVETVLKSDHSPHPDGK